MSVLEWSGALLPWRDDLDDLKERIGRLFRRPEPRRQIGLYRDGLIGEVDKKNGWQLAEYAGDPAPWRMQALLGRTIWDQERARDICREYVIERLGDASGVLVVDETGFLKKGAHSVGVGRQYSGTAGRIENCQVGVFLGYASAKGHALIDRRLYLPKEWATDVERREAACIPDEVAFTTKPKIAIAMVAAALDAGVPCAWVLGDAVYGSDKTLRVSLDERDKPYVLAVRGNEKLTMGDFHTYTAEQLAADLAPHEWQRLPAGVGSKGPRLYDWARLRLFRLQSPPWDHWLLVRRSIFDPADMAFYVTFAPDTTELKELAAVAGLRWTIEECFQSAKGEKRAVNEAREMGQAATLMFTLFWASWFHMYYGNYAEAQSLLGELAALADEEDASLFWKATENAFRGALFALTGKASDAVRAITSGMTSLRSTGAALYEPWHLSHLAMAYAELGQPDDARRCIDDAIDKVERSNEKWDEAEVNRIAGEVAFKSPARDTQKAQKYFERALSVARRQQQKSFELRAAMSMARLWRDQGKVRQARELLAPVYEWFTEGFDTRDLKEAKALLEQLAA